MNAGKAASGGKRASTDAPSVVIMCAKEEGRDVIAHWLIQGGMKVIVAADGYDAATALRRGCRWLITDRVLPPWPGLDQFPVLRRRYPSLGIIFLESPNIHDSILARVMGVNVTLSRPFTRRAVLEAFGIADITKLRPAP
jgi:DNA-binding response OmpR family regulator